MNINNLYTINQKNILVYGDLMIDCYIDGKVSRISPEAPVPVLKVTGETFRMGGAGNVIDNLIELKTMIRVLGCTGADDNGDWIASQLVKMGVDISFLKQSRDVKTIKKTRIISKNQQYIRLDDEEVKELPKEIVEEYLCNMETIMDGIDAVIISDYGKGSVVKEVVQALVELCQARKIVCVVDPKGTDYQKYKGATVCTPNVSELAIVTGMELTSEELIINAAEELKYDCQFEYLALTRSEKGIMLFPEKGKSEIFPAEAKEVIDVTGAGDTVVVMLTLAVSVGYTWREACLLANVAASIVCSKFGAAHFSLNELLSALSLHGNYGNNSLEEISKMIEEEKKLGKKIVFTNGCFDLLHAGHVYSFLQAKEKGDILVVAVNSDNSVRRIKGEKRPIICQEDRMMMVGALRCVDYVVLMDDDTPIKIIQQIKPDIVVKGKDWEDKNIPEREVIESYGGTFSFIEMKGHLSTTNTIQRIMESYK